MKKILLSSAIAAGMAVTMFGQGTVFLDNNPNTGVFNGHGGTAFNSAQNSGNPLYDAGVTQNGLVFTTDLASQWGTVGNGGPAGNQMLGTDVSVVVMGGATAGTVNTTVFSLTGGAIAGDNNQWGQFLLTGAAKSIAGTTAGSPVFLNVFMWQGGTFADYASAVAGNDFAGTTGVFQNASGGDTGSGVIPAPDMTGMPDLLLSSGPVPEPSIIALAGLGAAAFMGIRRRK